MAPPLWEPSQHRATCTCCQRLRVGTRTTLAGKQKPRGPAWEWRGGASLLPAAVTQRHHPTPTPQAVCPGSSPVYLSPINQTKKPELGWAGRGGAPTPGRGLTVLGSNPTSGLCDCGQVLRLLYASHRSLICEMGVRICDHKVPVLTVWSRDINSSFSFHKQAA